MNNIIPKLILIFLLLAIFTWTPDARALDVKLLWEKEPDFELHGGSISFSRERGDVLLYSQDKGVIYLYDNKGNTIFTWGPRIDRQPLGAEISSNGEVLLIKTSFTEDYKLEKRTGTWDERVHYLDRSGKEKWNVPCDGESVLSPSGKHVAIYPTIVQGGNLKMLNDAGKLIWEKELEYLDCFTFSPDGNYIVFTSGGGLYLVDIQGNILWIIPGVGECLTVSENALYVSTTTGSDIFNPGKSVVINKEGKIIYEGRGRLSIDGSKLVTASSGVVTVFSLPNLSIIGRYNNKSGGFISKDGKILSLIDENNNLFAYAPNNNEKKRIEIEKDFWSAGRTYDGRYMVLVENKRKIKLLEITK